ncbi:hypothetical protein Tco_1275213 [Tanacetum coccineum]
MITLLMQASPHPHQMLSLLVSIIHSSKAVLSNLIFADDVVIITDWNINDLSDIIQILNEFYKASGLKINISKSNIGVGVSMEDLDVMASSTGYTTDATWRATSWRLANQRLPHGTTNHWYENVRWQCGVIFYLELVFKLALLVMESMSLVWDCEGPLRGGFCFILRSRDGFLNDHGTVLVFNPPNRVPAPVFVLLLFGFLNPDHAANISTHAPEPSRHFNFTCDDDDNDEEYSIPLKDMPQISPCISLVPVSSIMEPEDSLIMGNEELSTIPEKESDEFIKSSVEDLIPIPRESEDTSGSDSENVLPSSGDFSPIFEEKSVTFSNPLFDSNNNFTSSDDESLFDEDVPKDVKIYSNPLFEFDDEYISSDVNHLFDKVLEDIECEDSYYSNLDELTFLVTPLFNSNEDKCLAPRDDIELLLHHDLSISIVSILEGFIDEPPLEENDDLFDLESKENDWKKILYDAPIDDLMTEDKVFDLEIHEKVFL